MDLRPKPDFSALLELLNSHSVEYMIVGGYALAYHGAPRSTGDFDIYIKPDAANARRIVTVLDEFGFGNLGPTKKDFQKTESEVQLGVPPVRMDFITSLTGVSWEDAAEGRVNGKYGEISVQYIGRDQLLTNKRATGRKRDLADVEMLEGE